MKVYVVWTDEHEVTMVDLFATRELAEASIEKDTKALRRRWEAQQRLAGTERTDEAYFQERQADGTMIRVKKRHKPPPPWEDYLRMHDKPWIEEYEVRDK